MITSKSFLGRDVASTVAVALSTTAIAVSSSVTTLPYPVTNSENGNVAFNEAYPGFLTDAPAFDSPYGVYNAALYQEQSNSSLGFTWMDLLRYDFQISEDAEEFLKNYDLINVLFEAKNHIRQYFPNEVLFLTLAPFVEQGDSRLLLYIKTSLPVEKACAKLDQLDEWILDHAEELHDILIDVMFI